ncbi:hypothetical protein G9A89_022973 [Geosiphon pyriformis]|nr:hypothetical protein G9A89_022973 [Geosiphon pyriformis]
MLRTIPYFLKGTAREWFENLAALFNDWNAFKAAFLEQFTNNNTFITLRNQFCNIKQESSKSVMTYLGKFNKLLKRICQLETNDYYSNAQILDQFIAGLKDKLIKKVHLHALEDLNSAIQHAKRYEMAIEEANHTKLVNLAIGKTSSAAEEKIDQLTKKTVIITADGIKKTSVGEINNFPFTLVRITIPVKVLVMDAPQYQAFVRNDWLQKANVKLDWKTQELQISYQEQYVRVSATCGTFNKHSEKALAFEFEPKEEKPIIETFMALGSTSNWAEETEQEHFTPHSEPKTPG